MTFLWGQWKFSRIEIGVENCKFGAFLKMKIHQMKILFTDLESRIHSSQLTAFAQ